MYALLTSKECLLPTVISKNSNDYVDLMLSGMYIEEDNGTKKDMEKLAETILEEIYGDIQRD